MKLKSFNLEKAIMGDPVVTRDGKPVSEIVHLKTVPTGQSVICVVDGRAYATSETGKFYTYNTESAHDLFMAPKIIKKSGWLNVYPNNATGYAVGYRIYSSKENADAGKCEVPNRVACIFVEWEEEE